MRVGIRKRKFDEAICRENTNQKEFSKKIKTRSCYLTTLKTPGFYKSRQSCGPMLRKKILDAFGGKYNFDDLFYCV